MKNVTIILNKKERELLQAAPSHETLLPEWELTSSYLTADSPPLLFCGDRLIGFGSRTIFAVNIYTGEELNTAGTINRGGFPYPLSSQRGEPHLTYSAGFLYFMDGRKLQAVRVMDGAPKDNWLSPTIDRVVGLKAYQDIITAVYLDLNGSTCVQGFNVQDGSEAWGPYIASRQSPGEIILGTGAVYFVAEGNLFAVNTDKGNTRFSKQASPAGTLTPDLNQTILPLISPKAIVCVGDQIYGLDPINGDKIWEFTSPNASGSITWFTALNDSLETIVASNSRGEVYALKADTGQVIWRSVLTAGGKPIIAGNEVYIDIPQQENLYVLSLSDGTTNAIYNLAGNVSKARPVLGNGHLFIPTDDGLLHAVPYGDQNAAYFDGVSAWIDASSKYRQNSDRNSLFDFSSDEISIEAWVRSSIGGCILSGMSETGNTFLMSLDEDGSICFAVMGSNKIDSDAAVSTKTWAVDGFWHHLAVIRKGMYVVMYLDGISIPVNLLQQRRRADDALQGQYGNISFFNGRPYHCADPPATSPQGLSIKGKNSLAIGALYWDFNGSVAIDHYFQGLLREVRIWDKPLEPASVISRKGAELNDLLPNLVGNWHLNFDWKHDSAKTAGDASFKNSVYLQEIDAVFHKANSCSTELAMDISAFPFQLEQESLGWPYTGQWQSRGQSKISSTPVALSGGTICFTDGEAIYGITKSKGLRKWGISLAGKFSDPVSYQDKVYLMSENFQEGLIEIDGDTGEKRILDPFKGIITKDMGNHIPAPAVSDRYITALSPDGYLWVWDKTLPSIDDFHKLHLGDWPDNLTIQGNLILATTEIKGSYTLHIIDASAGILSSKNIPVDSPVYHIDNLSLYCVYQGVFTVFNLPELAVPKYQTTSVEGTKITGLETSSDENLLVVTTSVGMVYGLSFATLDLRWMTTLPEKPGALNTMNGINLPTIDGRKVFVNSPSGTVAAIDGRNGNLLGLFYEKNPITTPMIIDNGTALFGCADATASQYLDGALHSIAFGKTYALRLGLDIFGNQVKDQNYAVIENSNILELMNVAECSVEAWVNTTEGGDILYCFPSKENKFGLHLFVDSDGKIGYTMIYNDEQTQKWNKISGLTDLTKACNGKWHHIATRLSVVSGLQIYLDGTPQDMEKSNDIIAEPVNLATGTKVFIGGSNTGALTDKVVYYQGMIAEVRLWDTYLSVEEISQHMHVKLHGDEPSLLCYWNFATLGINDIAPGKFDGKLLPENKNGCYWITDLPFNEPNYPYLTTKASVCGIPGTTGSTTYSLDIYAYKADNTALSNCDLELWYIKHTKDAGPDSIDITSGVKSATLAYVTPDHEALSQNCFRVTTDSFGKASLRITTSSPNHGPSLDLCSNFMTCNERYHINVLIDNQKLTRPAPPVLTAQSSLMQDYSYSSGGTIDSSNSRNTYRTILKVSTAAGAPVVGEVLEISALEHLTIEVSGTEYPISPQNSYPFKTDYNGELIVVVEAKDIKVADLSVHAGYMHAGECVTVSIDQDAHIKLANLSADDMSQPRMTNWKPDSQGGPEKSTMLDNNYKSHAGEISQSVRHVMSSVNQQPASCTRLRRNNRNKILGVHYDSNGVYIPMYQPSVDVPSDKAKTLVTMNHIMRLLPSDPDAIAQSVKSQSGKALGFVLDNSDPSGFRFSYLSNTQDLREEMGNPGMIHPIGAEMLLGGLFSWVKRALNAVKDAAAAALRAAQKLVIEIGEKVTAAIHYADEIVHKVIHTIKDAAEVVGEFFKQLGLLIWQIIKFLIFLFDWGAILKTHNIIKQTLLGGLNAYKGYAKSSIKGDFNRFFELVKKSIDGRSIPDSLATQSASGISFQYPPDSGSKHSNSVQGKYLTSKTQEHSDYASMPQNGSWPGGETSFDKFDPQTIYNIILENLGSVILNPSALISMSLADLKKIVENLLGTLIDLTEKMADTAIDLFIKIIDGFLDLVSQDITIPFISALYKFITGNSLTMLDLFCLIIAIPLNIFYGLVTGKHFGSEFENELTDDIVKMNPYLTTKSNLPIKSEGLGDSNDTYSVGWDWLFFFAELLYGSFQACLDVEGVRGRLPKFLVICQDVALFLVSLSLLFSSLREKNETGFDWTLPSLIMLGTAVITFGVIVWDAAHSTFITKAFFTTLTSSMAAAVIYYSVVKMGEGDYDSSQLPVAMEYICSNISNLTRVLTLGEGNNRPRIILACCDIACAGAVAGIHLKRCVYS